MSVSIAEAVGSEALEGNVGSVAEHEAPAVVPKRNPTSGETAAAARGRQAHQEWSPGEGYRLNEPLPSRKRPDAVNWETRDVVELKPDNPPAIRRGLRQVVG